MIWAAVAEAAEAVLYAAPLAKHPVCRHTTTTPLYDDGQWAEQCVACSHIQHSRPERLHSQLNYTKE